ncbi:reverse transcriptase domain-containing protein [Tanacetum coccineum]|uniref:Reverse transcriptase domain-containing protein n=1 Tax=Tanacetum coccineum TaxID=301880 RepID=A0ABQ5D4T8_9ASTR
MKLNPKKCAFGMREATFLGYKVDANRLRVCSDKVEAVLNLPSPKCLKDVQKLNGKLASLNRFLSKSAEKSLPFFRTLKKCTKKSDFQWTAEAEMAFKQMKKLIAELPMLTAPKEKEELIMYLAAAKEAISAVLMTERDGKQMPINYTPMEKLILALLGRDDIPIDQERHDKDRFLGRFIVERRMDHRHLDGFQKGGITLLVVQIYKATTKMAEYKLIAGLRIAEQIGIKNLQANVDSRLVANQVNGVYVAKELGMIKYLEKVKNLTSAFEEFSIKQVPRGENKKADTLSKMASTSFAHLRKQVLVEELKEKSLDEKEVLAAVEEEGRTWMTPIYEYLTEEILPEEKRKARAIRRKAGKLRFEGDLRGVMQHACRSKIRGGKSFKIRIEAKPVATITGAQVKKFIWDNIVCRFGLPGEIISDNGKQFKDNPFKDWCEKLCIRQCFASVKHPQANGLVERANRSLGEGIEEMLDERSKNWLEVISHVLWAHRTMIKSSNGETPFSLTYGAKAVIPMEISMPTLRTAEVDMIKNDEALGVNLDLLEEKREQIAIQEAKSKAKMEKYYNARVRSTSFCQGDLIYQNNEASRAEDGGKLGPKGEGPYEVT